MLTVSFAAFFFLSQFLFHLFFLQTKEILFESRRGVDRPTLFVCTKHRCWISNSLTNLFTSFWKVQIILEMIVPTYRRMEGLWVCKASVDVWGSAASFHVQQSKIIRLWRVAELSLSEELMNMSVSELHELVYSHVDNLTLIPVSFFTQKLGNWNWSGW